MSVQHKFYPVKFDPLQSLTKASDTVQFYVGIIFIIYNITFIIMEISGWYVHLVYSIFEYIVQSSELFKLALLMKP